jgi:hypothetical protein
MAAWIRDNPDAVLRCLFCGRKASVLSWLDSGKDEYPILLHCKNPACDGGDAVLRVMDINDLDRLAA